MEFDCLKSVSSSKALIFNKCNSLLPVYGKDIMFSETHVDFSSTQKFYRSICFSTSTGTNELIEGKHTSAVDTNFITTASVLTKKLDA